MIVSPGIVEGTPPSLLLHHRGSGGLRGRPVPGGRTLWGPSVTAIATSGAHLVFGFWGA